MQTHFGLRAASSVPPLLASLTLLLLVAAGLAAGLAVAFGPALPWPVAAALALAFCVLLSALALVLETGARR